MLSVWLGNAPILHSLQELHRTPWGVDWLWTKVIFVTRLFHVYVVSIVFIFREHIFGMINLFVEPRRDYSVPFQSFCPSTSSLPNDQVQLNDNANGSMEIFQIVMPSEFTSGSLRATSGRKESIRTQFVIVDVHWSIVAVKRKLNICSGVQSIVHMFVRTIVRTCQCFDWKK